MSNLVSHCFGSQDQASAATVSLDYETGKEVEAPNAKHNLYGSCN